MNKYAENKIIMHKKKTGFLVLSFFDISLFSVFCNHHFLLFTILQRFFELRNSFYIFSSSDVCLLWILKLFFSSLRLQNKGYCLARTHFRTEGDIAGNILVGKTDGSRSRSFANFDHSQGNNCQMDANLDNNLSDICTSISFVCLHYQPMSKFEMCVFFLANF